MSGPRLITDADVLTGRVSGPIVLGPGVLLTPAARDRAVARGLEIVEAEDVAAWQAARQAVRAGAAAGSGPAAPMSTAAVPPTTAATPPTTAAVPPTTAAVPPTTASSCGCGATPASAPVPAAAGPSPACGCGAPAGRCTCGGETPAGDPTLARLADGVYLVRVRDGLVERARPVAGDGHSDPAAVRRADPR